MEPNQNPHHHHHHHHHFTSPYFSAAAPTAASPAGTPSPTNGLLPPHASAAPTTTELTPTPSAAGGTGSGSAGPLGVYPHSVGPTVTTAAAAVDASSSGPPKRKRGRPRKYGTPEQALAAKKTAAASSSSASREKREAAAAAAAAAAGASPSSPSYSGSSRKSQQQLASLGSVGQGFTPHVINVAAGEDVGQKIMLFMQQTRREICILSASGSISTASLRQPATSGGSITYNGRFDIISLSGSYVRTEMGGRTGGLSVCLSNTDGEIVGGGVGGPLTAAGPVQVIVGSFMLDNKKDSGVSIGGDASVSMLPAPVGGPSVSSVGFHSHIESSPGGNPFMIHSRGMHVAPSRPTDWRGGLDARTTASFDFTGRAGRGGRQSPENGDYDQLDD